jgi:hypothetical protein
MAQSHRIVDESERRAVARETREHGMPGATADSPFYGRGYDPRGVNEYGRRVDRVDFGGNRLVRGPHAGKGPSGYRRSDERLREIACDALTEDDLIDASGISVEVTDCEITLTGTVEDRAQKRAAEECVERIPGVRDVHNQLTLASTSSRGA